MNQTYNWKASVAAFRANASRTDWQRRVAAQRAAATKAANKKGRRASRGLNPLTSS